MKRRILSSLMMLLIVIMAGAQNPLPLNPNVKHGVLPNGLTYYILHNEKPANRANFYIAQRVGSALETNEQLGLAHFLEHMAFSGTKHYPGKNMLNYLESNGIRFGDDVNAYTDYEETVYNIDNVPTNKPALMDSVLLAIRDWSCDILLEDDEIDAERKIIQEEWRSRNTANFRYRLAMAPKVFEEVQYHQTPIGTMDVVMNFPYKAIRDYYHKWYRPDLQGIIIVGDFNAEEMEKKFIELFSTIPAPVNPAPRDYVHVSDNDKPIFFAYEDPEIKADRIDFQIKFDKLPREMQNTDMAYVTNLAQNIISQLINNRIEEHLQDADCKYANAGVFFTDLYPSKTKGIFNVAVIGKGNLLEAFDDAFGIVARACGTGFTQSELDRVVANMKSQLDAQYNERNNVKNEAHAKELINAFKDNVSAMDIETERDFINKILANLPVEAINQMVSQVITPTNQIITIQQQKKEGKVLPSESETLAVVNNALNKQYEAYVDNAVTEPLIAKLPKKGKVKKVKDGKFGTKELILSNGIKVIVKPTNFKEDQVIFQAFRKGGNQTLDIKDAANAQMLEDAVALSNIGPFDNKQMARYLTGKQASVGYTMGSISENLQGGSTVKDLPTMMELIYTFFTNINPNKENYDNTIARILPQIEAQEKSPEFAFKKQMKGTLYNNNPMQMPLTAQMIKDADYNRMLQMYKESVANPAEYTFIFTGNVDLATLTPLLEQYVASLKTSKVKTPKKITDTGMVEGNVANNFTQEMAAPADWLVGVYSGTNLPNNAESQVEVSLLGDILGTLFTEIIREREGGAYSPSVSGSYDIINNKWSVMYHIITNEEQAPRMLELADEIFRNTLKNGVTAEQFNKVKSAMLSQYENSIKENSYWHENIRLYHLLGKDYVTSNREAIENLTLDQFNNFLKGLYDGKNRIQVNMHGIMAE